MLDVAAEMFAERGFHATSMDDIAAACGVTKPMLYSYFGSKPGLRAAIVERTGTFLINALMAVSTEPDPRTRLARTVTMLVGFLYRDTARWQIAFSAMKGESELAQQIMGFRRAVLDITAMTFADFRPPGLAAATARARVTPYAYALMGAAESGAEWWLATPGISLEETERMALNVLDALIGVVRRELGSI
ncbi:TetR/AcrR family transcriptional regulator [Oleomonas cavernae]|uniref:TetR/AcrR family transcriptional regulator n=2 Tax=Oleomonas cavernae TaxID=2320859 RepID=A0A418WUH5_9PROT|nr:TetR/AcrR family transcriptional regulator [Oleomonas cavernae]